MNNLSVTLYSKYDQLGASSRLRMYQFLPLLEELGVSVRKKPLFGNGYLRNIYINGGRLNKARAFGYYPRRVFDALCGRSSDITWIEGELLPYLLESLLTRSLRPYVVEYDDALFHRYDRSANRMVREVLGSKIDQIMANAACVIAGNNYLAAHAIRAGAARVEVVPTVVDPSRYIVADDRFGKSLTIGWIGSPATEKYLNVVAGVLADACKRHSARLLLIGPRQSVRHLFPGVDVEICQWVEEEEASMVAKMDVGIMPLVDTEWERGKCGYKLIQYMASGVPFIASPVGVNDEIAKHGGGLLADSQEEWREAIDRLLDDAPLRSEMGKDGRKSVTDWYSVDVQAPRLAAIFRDVARNRDKPCAA
ncbi:glycosyltransferase family 4 protein [Fulvimonas sp. R45]|uniref:glycosyltransferase family 4 protein n=1 Tax=Fulvimonas sp. R45 TaxID=3045937 RepID=UPI00265FF850|nr:glycosyltransferase family 4 protein [Fulvimonas sp. R45]MDO1528147.1 glycosyltransferase family 4 protein [Fulvimonas sp. R45]